MKKIIVFSVVCLALFLNTLSFAKVSHPDTRVVIVEGEAAIIKDDIGKAKEEAKRQALRTAVEEVAGVYITSDTLVKNFQVIEDNIYTKSQGFAYINKIIEEEKTGFGTYKIKLEASVSLKPLANKLKDLGLLKEWRVMVVVPETHKDMEITTQTVEGTMNKKLRQAGFKVIDPESITELRESQMEEKAAEGDAQSIEELYRQFGVDILISGEGWTEKSARTQSSAYGVDVSLYSCNAHLNMKAIRADTGEIIAQDESYARAVDSSEGIAGKKAISNAAAKLADFFITEIMKVPSALISEIELQISGLYFSDADDFEKVLKKTKGVRKVSVHNYAGTIATFDVDYEGKAKDLAVEMERGEDFAPFNLVVKIVSKNKIEAEIVEKEE